VPLGNSLLGVFPHTYFGRTAGLIEGGKRVKAELNIEGMHCDACAQTIKTTLEDTAGVHSVDVTFKRKTAIVDFDENTVQPATLIKKIQDSGYQATFSGQSQSGVGA
jgi:copper chaperone CopZ